MPKNNPFNEEQFKQFSAILINVTEMIDVIDKIHQQTGDLLHRNAKIGLQIKSLTATAQSVTVNNLLYEIKREFDLLEKICLNATDINCAFIDDFNIFNKFSVSQFTLMQTEKSEEKKELIFSAVVKS